MSADTETLAEVLAAHRHPGEFLAGLGEAWLTCSCDERIDLIVRDGKVSSSEAAAMFEAHQAEHLAARIVQARAGEGALRERIEALADELQQDIEDRREDTPDDDGSWPITRAEWVGHIAGLGDALAQLRAALTTADPS